MPFIVKDLMISVLGEHGAFGPVGVGKDCLCTGCTGCTGCTRCTGCSNKCTGGTDVGGFDEVINPDPTQLAMLKQQLTAALAEVEARQAAFAAQMRPQTVEQAEELERRLQAALDEVRMEKQRLQGPGK